MKRKERVRKIGIAFLMALILLVNEFVPLQAAESTKTLRVAFYPLEGFFEYDESGNETGYGVELLNKISQYTGITFTYVKADSWESTKQMLIDGKADIRMPGTMPVTPSDTLSYSQASILDTYEVLLTMGTRTDLYYEDYHTFKKLKIAVTDYSYKLEEIQNYLTHIGVKKDQLVFCKEYQECDDLLREGKVDALVTNIMDMTSDMKLLERFNSFSNYITMPIGDEDMQTINKALDQIKLNEPLFISNLYEKWFPDRTNIPLTVEESTYLSKLDSITFAFYENEGFLSHYRGGKFYGIYVEQARMICEKLGVDFKAVSADDCEKGTASTDVYAGFYYDLNYAAKWNYTLSSPIRSNNYYIIQKKGKSIDTSHCRIAAIKNYKSTSCAMQNQYKNATYVYADSYEDCMKKVENGTADLTVINNDIAEYYLAMYQFSNLSVKLSADDNHLYCFAAVDGNDILASILTKGISMVSESELDQTYIVGQEDRPESNSFLALLYQKPGAVVGVLMVAMALIVSAIFLLYFARKRSREKEVLEDALSAKNSFMARMSHDMRTPLNVIIGMSKLAEENENCLDTNQCLEKIWIASDFLLGLINDILDLERINSGKTKLNLTPYPGKEFNEYIEAVIYPLCQQKNIEFAYEVDGPKDFVIMQDKLRINQVYFNLLSNAVKFTPEGGKVTLHTDVSKISDRKIFLHVLVSDNGIGMSEEFQKHMFEPFTQESLKVTPVGTGTGLGLSIVKKMCELMKMTIRVESHPGKGTTFILEGTFDQALENDRLEYERESKKENLEQAEKTLNGKTILVCEDHPLNQEIIQRILEKKGMVVEMAEDGKQGVMLFSNSGPNRIDGILMDVRMPVMDGLEATRQIRNLDRRDARTVPIIALTANAYEEDINKCREAGMNDHLAKPIEPEKVYETILRYIK